MAKLADYLGFTIDSFYRATRRDLLRYVSGSGGSSRNTQTSLVDGASVTWDYNGGNVASIVLSGNRTLTMSNVPAGSCGLIKVKQDSTGGRTLTLPGNLPSPFALSTGANQEDLLGFYYDGNTFYWSIENYGTVTSGDTTPPVITSMTATSATNIRVVTSEAIAAPTVAGWSFNNGSAITPSAVAQNGTNTYDFTVASLAAGQTITASYNSATGNWLDAAGNEVVTFSGTSVTNGLSSSANYLTIYSSINAQLEQYNSNKGLQKKSSSSDSWTNGVQWFNETLGVGEKLIVKLNTTPTKAVAIGLHTARTSDMSGATWQYSFTAAYNLTANGQARTTTTQSGAVLALSAGMLIRISYNTGALVFEYSNNGGTSWTTIGTSGTAPSGTYFIGFDAYSVLGGFDEIYKA